MKRSPSAALWLSLLPGAGHVYLGHPAKGAVLILLLASIFQIVDHGADGFGIVIPFVWLYAMLDAYRTAVTHNHAIDTGLAPAEAPPFSLPKWWGGILVALGVIFLLENNGWVDFDFLWNFWPLGLVAAGIYILTRKQTDRPKANDAWAPPPPAPAPPSETELSAHDEPASSSFEADAENV